MTTPPSGRPDSPGFSVPPPPSAIPPCPTPAYTCIKCSYLRLSPDEPNPTHAERWLANQNPPILHFDRATQYNHISVFGYALLTRTVVDLLRRYSPLLEVGAGTGYWAYETDKAGGDIIATDPRPASMTPQQRPWRFVYPLNGQEALVKHPDRNLLLCWPETSRWPNDTVRSFQGQYLIYIGEDRDGCTGNDEMFDALETLYRPIETLTIPQFAFNHDTLTVYRRLGHTAL